MVEKENKQKWQFIIVLLLIVIISLQSYQIILTQERPDLQSTETTTTQTVTTQKVTPEILVEIPETREELFSDLESLGCELIRAEGMFYSPYELNYQSFRVLAFKTKVVFYAMGYYEDVELCTIFEGTQFTVWFKINNK